MENTLVKNIAEGIELWEAFHYAELQQSVLSQFRGKCIFKMAVTGGLG